MSVGDGLIPGRPSTSTDDDHFVRVPTVIRRNHHLTVREVVDEVQPSQWMRKGSPLAKKKKVRTSRSKIKVLLAALFLNCKVNALQEFVPTWSEDKQGSIPRNSSEFEGCREQEEA
ncbi:hypothetical protein CDAR_567881 [Caerostris darwini]|uniref:Uncharacterized protein n=1 Tax=Caerostris darwini TaxID=1538125 RepID=A0AAV4SJ87_9ARAC|nr:hypothetical protein CDAR_567881 [Caerostris darwini]